MNTLKMITLFGLLFLAGKGMLFTGKAAYHVAKPVAHAIKVVLI